MNRILKPTARPEPARPRIYQHRLEAQLRNDSQRLQYLLNALIKHAKAQDLPQDNRLALSKGAKLAWGNPEATFRVTLLIGLGQAQVVIIKDLISSSDSKWGPCPFKIYSSLGRI